MAERPQASTEKPLRVFTPHRRTSADAKSHTAEPSATNSDRSSARYPPDPVRRSAPLPLLLLQLLPPSGQRLPQLPVSVTPAASPVTTRFDNGTPAHNP